ncbi:hypothetical protein FQN57_002372 [Myotisia sp. PD_48]|nr:hypothetical protein FQN57_002372 [Myotisia sp. PD_48]
MAEESPFLPLRPSLRLISSRARTPSRSPTRSPDRRSWFLADHLDPLLSNLSPEATLLALSSIEEVQLNGNTQYDVLIKSITDVSAVDRAFGIRAAVAAKSVKEWHTEVLFWHWPDRDDVARGIGFLSPTECERSANPKVNAIQFFGCLPATTLIEYETRIEEIKDAMEDLGIDELKEHVLTAHIPSRSRPQSANSTTSTSTNSRLVGYMKMSDFTAVVTATILRALPVISKLSLLLSIWDVRVQVLRLIPGLLDGFKHAKLSIGTALDRLQNGLLPNSDDKCFSRETFQTEKDELQNLVSNLGRRVDGMLDLLEGREDSLPDVWIDEIESIESQFANWSFGAEKKLLENELRFRTNDKKSTQDYDTPEKKLPETNHPTEPIATSPLEPKPEDTTNSNMSSTSPEPAIALQRPPNQESHCQDPKKARGVTEFKDNIQMPANVQPGSLSSSQQLPQSPNLVALPQFDSKTSERSSSQQLPQSPNPVALPQFDSNPSEHTPDIVSIDAPPKDQNQCLEDILPEVQARIPCLSHKTPALSPVGVQQLTHVDNYISSGSDSIPSKDATGAMKTDKYKPIAIVSDDSHTYEKPKKTPEPLALPRISECDTLRPRPTSTFSYASGGSSAISYTSNAVIQHAEIAALRGSPILVSPTLSSNDGSVIHHPQKDVHDSDRSRALEELAPSYEPTAPGLRPFFERSMSLPLARYINDDHNPVLDDMKHSNQLRKASVASIEVLPKENLRSITISRRGSLKPDPPVMVKPELRRSASTFSLPSAQRLKQKVSRSRLSDIFRFSTSRSSEGSQQQLDKQPASAPTNDANPLPTPPNSTKRPSMHNQPQPPSPGPERYAEADSPLSPLALPAEPNTPETPERFAYNTPMKPSDDVLDNRINSILTTIPKIRLNSGIDRDSLKHIRTKEPRSALSYRGIQSPSPTPTRSSTPTPSLVLTPAVAQSRRSHTHTIDDTRVYHLHRGGKVAPIKLLVRLVGKDGERVMVRVGGGWADLGEYLREYALHHGRRGISNSFELQNIPSNSPGTNSRTSRAPTPTNGRSTPVPPSRPGSAFDIRPPSSLTVRKTRRSTGAGGAERPNLTVANIQKISEEGIDTSRSPYLSSRRRLSVSSAASMSISSAIGDSPYSPASRALSTATGPISTPVPRPLGLAGPKPRSRQVSMSPESEAWVEDIVGQARKNATSLKPHRSSTNLRSSLRPIENRNEDNSPVGKLRSGTKYRSVSDIGTASGSLNKRVFLRRMSKGQD